MTRKKVSELEEADSPAWKATARCARTGPVFRCRLHGRAAFHKYLVRLSVIFLERSGLTHNGLDPGLPRVAV
jgi:hypothetical protein